MLHRGALREYSFDTNTNWNYSWFDQNSALSVYVG